MLINENVKNEFGEKMNIHQVVSIYKFLSFKGSKGS
jgi:hypothetical protein